MDGQITPPQGIQVFLDDGSRIVYRLSGTGTSGAKLRVYPERFPEDAGGVDSLVGDANLGRLAADIARISHFTGRDEPSVRT